MDIDGCYCWQVLLEPSTEQAGGLWADYLPEHQPRIESWVRNAPMDSPSLHLGDQYFVMRGEEDGSFVQVSPSGTRRKMRRVVVDPIHRD